MGWDLGPGEHDVEPVGRGVALCLRESVLPVSHLVVQVPPDVLPALSSISQLLPQLYSASACQMLL
eukprot:2283516-Rhodomonas_salina.1